MKPSLKPYQRSSKWIGLNIFSGTDLPMDELSDSPPRNRLGQLSVTFRRSLGHKFRKSCFSLLYFPLLYHSPLVFLTILVYLFSPLHSRKASPLLCWRSIGSGLDSSICIWEVALSIQHFSPSIWKVCNINVALHIHVNENINFI